MKQDINHRIVTLRQEIQRHDYLYYVQAKPEISDQDYDALMRELHELEQQHPELITPDSPTQRIGGEPIEGFATVRHTLRMMSIDNTYDAGEVREFDRRVREGLGTSAIEYVMEPKIDGIAVSLRYEKGLLVQAATRGDGAFGDDITANARTIQSIPMRLRPEGNPPEVLEIRGEIYMPDAAFIALNANLVAKGEEPMKNPRNATGGTLKQLDPRVAAQRKLAFFAHGLGEVRPLVATTYWEFLKLLREWGIPTTPDIGLAKHLEEVLAYITEFASIRPTLPFDTDGMVVKVNDFSQRDILGVTSKSPRWVIAYKYQAEQVETVLKDVTWQVGKGGRITPVAEMEAVDVAGSTIRRASLHNIDQIRQRDIHIGDTVLIEKAGEVIPYVVRPLPEKRPSDARVIEPPSHCPSCGQPATRETDTPYVRCNNPECPAQIKERVRWFCARNQMDIEGAGEALVEQLIDAQLVKTFADLYRLKVQDLTALERMGEKSAANVIDAIAQSRTRSLDHLLAGLGIVHVGNSTARDLAGHFGSLDALSKATIADLDAVKGVDVVVATGIHNFFNSPAGKHAIEQLQSVGVNPHTEVKTGPSSDQSLAGQSIVVTGTLEHFDRTQIEELIIRLGGRASGSVSKKTSFVIAGASAGSKLDKARSLGVPILSEKQFIEKIGPAATNAATTEI